MILSNRTQDMIRAKIYLLIENREQAKESAHTVLMYLNNYQPRPEAVNVKVLIPLPVTLRESMCTELPDLTMDANIITLTKALKYNQNGSFDYDWMVE